jgi:c-di-GMP-binding flagellar brake protein YcgR
MAVGSVARVLVQTADHQQTTLSDDERYAVHNVKEIVQILSDLAEKQTMIHVAFNHGHDWCLTTVVDVDTKNHAVHLDIGRDELFNSKLLASHHVEFVIDEGIKIKWTSSNLSAVMLKDGKALRIALPHKLIRVQRREFFRLATPIATPVPCVVPYADEMNPDGESALDLTLVDASIGGIGATAADPLPSVFTEGAGFDGCKISFPGVGETSVTLRIKSIKPITMMDGVVRQRLGLEYVNPSRGNQGLIQRYTFNLERDAMMVANNI